MSQPSRDPQSNPATEPEPQPLNLTLEPLRTDGPAALAPDAEAGIVRIALSSVELHWRNAFNEVTIRQADDLFECAARSGRYYDTIPKGADLAKATLDVQFAESPEPHLVEIAPPHSLKLQKEADAPRILALLARRGFRTAQKLALVLFLAGICAPDACFAADDDEDGDAFENCARSRG